LTARCSDLLPDFFNEIGHWRTFCSAIGVSALPPIGLAPMSALGH
jgi:hypothetical protein